LGYSNEAEFPNVLNSWSDKLHPEDKEKTLNAFAAHIIDRTGKTPFDVQYRLLKKSGEYGWFKAFGETIRDAEGYAIRVAGGIQEITKDKISANYTQAEQDDFYIIASNKDKMQSAVKQVTGRRKK